MLKGCTKMYSDVAMYSAEALQCDFRAIYLLVVKCSSIKSARKYLHISAKKPLSRELF